MQLEAGDSILSSTQMGFVKAIAPHPLRVLLFGEQGALHRWHRLVRQTAPIIAHPGQEESARSQHREPQSTLPGHLCLLSGERWGERTVPERKARYHKQQPTGIFALPSTGNLSSTKERILLFIQSSASLRANPPAFPACFSRSQGKWTPPFHLTICFFSQAYFRGGGETGRSAQGQDPKEIRVSFLSPDHSSEK